MRRASPLLVVTALLTLLACPRRDDDDALTFEHGTLHRDETLEHDGAARRYHLFEPTDPDGARPLVVVLHGGGADIDAFLGATGGAAPLAGTWLDIADREGLFVVVPQGETTKAGPHWNDCRGDCTHCGELDDAGFLLALVDEIAASHAIDPARVYVTGESNGGFMTLRLAQEHPDRFAAYGVTIAVMPADNDCAAATTPVSLAFFLGTEDVTSRYEGGDAALEGSGTMMSAADTIAHWTTLAACDAPPEETEIEDGPDDDGSTVTRFRHTCPTTGREVLLYRVTGGGHVVPSIAEQVTAAWESVVGRQNHDIETAEEQWTFFQGFARATE